MPINVTCPHCGRSFLTPDSAAGRKFKCKSCGGALEVPTGGGPAVAAGPASVGATAPAAAAVPALAPAPAAQPPAAAPAAPGVPAYQPLDLDAPLAPSADIAGSFAPVRESDQLKIEKAPGQDTALELVMGKPKGGGPAPAGAGPAGGPSAPGTGAGGAGAAAMAAATVTADVSVVKASAEKAVGAVLRAVQPGRLLLAIATIAAGWTLFALVPAILSLFSESLASWSEWVSKYGMIAIVLLGAAALARCDLKSLRGESVPGPIAAFFAALPGAVPSLLVPGLLVVAADLIPRFEGKLSFLSGLPYVGALFILVLGLLLYAVNIALYASVSLGLWILVPQATTAGINPVPSWLGLVSRVRRQGAALALRFMVFIAVAGVLLAPLCFLLFYAGLSAKGAVAGGFMAKEWAMTKVGMWLCQIFSALTDGVINGISFGAILSAFVCGGCQEVAEGEKAA